MKHYVNIDREIERMIRITGTPRLGNGVAVDIVGILRERLDFDVAYIRELSIRGKPASGALVPDRKLVLVEANDIVERQRFTLAHECGHLFLDYRNAGSLPLFDLDELKSFLCAPSDIEAQQSEPSWMNLREVLANRFAAHLLMPESLTRDLFRQHRSVDACANDLAVSRQALSIRLSQLGLAT